MKPLISCITLSATSDNGCSVKKPCCFPSNSTYSIFFPNSFKLLAQSSTLSFKISSLPTTTNIGSRVTSARLGLDGPKGFTKGWSVVPPIGRDNLQNLLTVGSKQEYNFNMCPKKSYENKRTALLPKQFKGISSNSLGRDAAIIKMIHIYFIQP